MAVVRNFPRSVTEIENLWITLSDGCRLAARVWMPDRADVEPVPAILEFLPYRKRDGTAVRDQLTHPYFAGYGHACFRVDMRGLRRIRWYPWMMNIRRRSKPTALKS